jgi:hypothetical protein
MTNTGTQGYSQYASAVSNDGVHYIALPPRQLGEKMPYNASFNDARSSMLGVTPSLPVERNGTSPVQNGRNWDPGFLSRLPWFGFAGLVLSLCCEFPYMVIDQLF